MCKWLIAFAIYHSDHLFNKNERNRKQQKKRREKTPNANNNGKYGFCEIKELSG